MSRRLHVLDTGPGPGGGRPLLLLHGWSCHGGFFEPQVDAFAGRTRVLVPDLPGHGRTRDVPLSVEAAADAVAAELDARDLSDVLAVGWSMGALVAWSLIARHGAHRLGGLVVVDMSPKVLNDAEWRLGLRNGLDAAANAAVLHAIANRWPAVAHATLTGMFAEGRPPDAALAAFAAREIAAADPASLAPMWESLTAQDARPLLPRVRLPVVLACGARSRLYDSAVADWQAERLPAARVARFAASGHAPHLEEPAAFNALLGSLL